MRIVRSLRLKTTLPPRQNHRQQWIVAVLRMLPQAAVTRTRRSNDYLPKWAWLPDGRVRPFRGQVAPQRGNCGAAMAGVSPQFRASLRPDFGSRLVSVWRHPTEAQARHGTRPPRPKTGPLAGATCCHHSRMDATPNATPGATCTSGPAPSRLAVDGRDGADTLNESHNIGD